MNIYFPNIKYYQIDDNFYMIYVQTKTNIFYSEININVGSINEKPGEEGLAHFFEHMIFQGTTTYNSNDLAMNLEFIGADYNASTGPETTYYYISGKKSDYNIILNTLLDIFLHPTFPESFIETEIRVVLEELARGEDNAQQMTYSKLIKLIYNDTDSRYSRPVIGLKSVLKNITRDKLLEFHKNYLNGKKVLGIIGSVDESDILNLVQSVCKKEIKTWNPKFKTFESKLIIPYIKYKCKNHFDIIKSPQLNQTHVCIGFKSISTYSKWSYVTDILENILTSGMTSKLAILRTKHGLTYSQISHNIEYLSHGMFCIYYSVNPAGLELSLMHVLKILLEMGDIDVSEKELQTAKNSIETAMIYLLENPRKIAATIVNYVMADKDPYELKKIYKRYKSITPELIRKFAKRVFKKSNIHIVINGNTEITTNKLNNLINLL